MARISPMGEGPPLAKNSDSPVIPPHNPHSATANHDPSSKSTAEPSLISFDDDSDEFVDAEE